MFPGQISRKHQDQTIVAMDQPLICRRVHIEICDGVPLILNSIEDEAAFDETECWSQSEEEDESEVTEVGRSTASAQQHGAFNFYEMPGGEMEFAEIVTVEMPEPQIAEIATVKRPQPQYAKVFTVEIEEIKVTRLPPPNLFDIFEGYIQIN